MTVKTFRTWCLVHKWTSVICTIFLLLLCVTGLPLVFRDELAVLLGEAIEPPEVVTATVSVNLEALVKDARDRRPHDHVKFLIRDQAGSAWFVSLGTTLTAQDNSALFMYDVRTGAFLQDRPVNQGILNVLVKLQVELLLGLPGTLFLGATGLLFLTSVVSGMVVYGPFMRKLPFGTMRQDRSRQRPLR